MRGASMGGLVMVDREDCFTPTPSMVLRASIDALLDPQVLIEAMQDSSGQIVDFVYREVNTATCDYLGLAREDLLGRGVVETMPGIEATLLPGYIRCLETGEPMILDDFAYDNEILLDTRLYDVRATRAGADMLSLTWRDVTDRFRTAQRIAASEEQYRLLAENSTDVVVHVRDGTVVWVSPSVNAVLGAPDSYWVGRQIRELSPPEDAPAFARRMAALASGDSVADRIRVVSLDGVTHWMSMRAGPFYHDSGHADGILASLRLIDGEVAAEEQARVAGLRLEEARREQARADALYRRLMDSAAVGMCLTTPEGRFTQVNDALCQFFGYGAETLTQMDWQQLEAPDYVDAELINVENMILGEMDSYRWSKKFIHADGHPIWGDLSVACIRDADGQVEVLISQIVDITTEVQAREQLTASEELNRALAQDLQSELSSAAKYVQAVLPGDLDGPVSVSSFYQPSSTVGGDCFDYRWLDDDHLMVKMLDVCGHGARAALLAVSVHNLLRAGTLSPEVMRSPERVLTELNAFFQMERHSGQYFTIWLGIYQPSTRTLTYAGAGHPPALLFTVAGQLTKLPSQSPPVGTFDDTAFTTTSVPVPPRSQLLIYSDGAYGLALDGGGQWSHEDFVASCTQLAGSPNWSLDDIIDNLRRHSTTEIFNDDCSLVRINFD